jgi:carbon monoxide dehydrogenase subunit G
MINIIGSIKRAFIFPAPPKTALTYYSDISRVTQFLPHISLVHSYAQNQIRMLYETVELGVYTIQIYSDLESSVDWEEMLLHVYPVKLETADPVETETSMRHTTGQGLFAIDTQFFDMGEQTRVEYAIQLKAELERPLGMRLMPKRVVNRIAQSITDERVREIADGFIKESIDAFPEWQANNQPMSK